jgi:hypothetical protein
MDYNFASQQWMWIALFFFGIIGYIAWIRWKDNRWIDEHIGQKNVLAQSFGVHYFGTAREPGAPRKSSGFLLLHRKGLLYRSRLKKIEVNIPGNAIKRVYHDRSHKGVDLHQSLIKVDFINARQQPDTAAFKVPYPPQWIRMIENAFNGKNDA